MTPNGMNAFDVAELKPEATETKLNRMVSEDDGGITFPPEYDAEIRRRIASIRDGSSPGIPWKEVQARMKAKLGL